MQMETCSCKWKANRYIGYCFSQEQFYQSRIDNGAINKTDLGLYVFASKPSSGAAIFKF